MSIHAINWVFRHSEATLGSRLVLLALADFAHDDGSHAFPSVATIATKARLSERLVQYALRSLEADGAIVRAGKGPNGTNMYSIIMAVDGGADSAPGGVQPTTRGGAESASGGVQPIAPEPSELQPSELQPPKTLTPSSSTIEIADTEDSPDVIAICDLLASCIRSNDPKAKPNPASKGWRTAARLLLDRDDRDRNEVERVIRWCQHDEFWRANILSMPKFRAQYAKLRLQSERRNGHDGRNDGVTAAGFYNIAAGGEI